MCSSNAITPLLPRLCIEHIAVREAVCASFGFIYFSVFLRSLCVCGVSLVVCSPCDPPPPLPSSVRCAVTAHLFGVTTPPARRKHGLRPASPEPG